MENVFSQRLVNARKIRCMSQRELCNSVGVELSPTAIAKYEKGLMMPSSKILIALANALEMKVDYFFRPFSVRIDTSKFEFRRKSCIGAKKIESIKHLVCTEIEKYLEIESILGIDSTCRFDGENILVEGENEAIILAQKFRRDMNIGSDAIVSATDLLESSGAKIIEIDYDNSFSGTCNDAVGLPVIVVNKNMTSERKRLTMFHELGHLLMKCADGVDKEKMCNVFANEVLIPSDRFKNLIGESRHDIALIELQSIQREYGISIDALMAKAAQLNIITSSRYISYHKKKNAVPAFKQAVEGSVYPTEHTSRFECLVYRALASELITYARAASLLDCDVAKVRDTLDLM